MVTHCKKKHILIRYQKYGKNHTMEFCVRCRTKVCLEHLSIWDRIDRNGPKIFGIGIIIVMCVVMSAAILIGRM